MHFIANNKKVNNRSGFFKKTNSAIPSLSRGCSVLEGVEEDQKI